jgi:hypothetical protein
MVIRTRPISQAADRRKKGGHAACRLGQGDAAGFPAAEIWADQGVGEAGVDVDEAAGVSSLR